jgi:hypothetical protein
MQTLIFTFAYLIIFVFALAFLWAIGAEALVFLNIKTNIISKIKSPFLKLYRWMQLLNIKSSNVRKINMGFGKSYSHSS